VWRFDELTTGSHRIAIEQGIEMRRPALIVLEVDVERGKVAASRIGGDAVIVAEGTLDF
jgi:trans-2,3-dihydro-3-hydroxyanthranilate isomerase